MLLMMIKSILTWFDGLNDTAQIDDVVVDSLSSFIGWLNILSFNQQLVLLFLAVALIALISRLAWLARSMFVRCRKWYRRKRIPSNINLHLDGDKTDTQHGE